MKPILDEHGNEIKIGDLSLLYLATPLVKGRIIEIVDGEFKRSLMKRGEHYDLKPGQVTIHVDLVFNFDPRDGQRMVGGLSLLGDPDPKKAEAIRALYDKNRGPNRPKSGLIELPN